MQIVDLDQLKSDLSEVPKRRRCGHVIEADGGSITIDGLRGAARLGDGILVGKNPDGPGAQGEIIALSADGAQAMVLGGSDGVGLGDPVWLTPLAALRPSDEWLGRVIDATGAPIDDLPLDVGRAAAPLHRSAPPAATRGGLGPRLASGLAAIDTILPLARGQRIGIFAGSGVGKSTLLTTLARNVEADVVVFALIGERGRELGEFITNGLGPEGMKRAVLVAATSDESPLLRRRAAWAAMAVAEFFRDQGRHVLLVLDSLTRFAEAHREIALTAGETPSLRAYPPSTASMIAALAERAGPGGRRADDGAITAVFSILVAGSDMEEPVADITRGVLDGHIVLDRAIAERGRFPAIDIGRSVSRSLPGAASQEEGELIAEARRLTLAYEKATPMVQTGLYQAGADPAVDRAVALSAPLDTFFAEPSANPKAAFRRLAEILAPEVRGHAGTADDGVNFPKNAK